MNREGPPETIPAGLEQRCVRAGCWLIEGWDVRRLPGYEKGWRATRFPEDGEIRRYLLADIRDEIIRRRDAEHPL